MNPKNQSAPRVAFRPSSSLALLVGFSALAVASPLPLVGQPPGDPPSTPNAPMPSRPAEDFKDHSPGAPQKPSRASERVLVQVAALSGETTRLSQLATQRATHAAVRDFAGQVTQASQALVEEIDRVAAAKNVAIRPNADSAKDEHGSDKGSDFDETYLRRTMRLHEDAIAALEEYTAGRDVDPQIAALAELHLPGLHQHLRQAENLDERVSRHPSARRDDLIASEPKSGLSLRYPPVVLALHEESVE